jgi:hypothetical protein
MNVGYRRFLGCCPSVGLGDVPDASPTQVHVQSKNRIGYLICAGYLVVYQTRSLLVPGGRRVIVVCQSRTASVQCFRV